MSTTMWMYAVFHPWGMLVLRRNHMVLVSIKLLTSCTMAGSHTALVVGSLIRWQYSFDFPEGGSMAEFICVYEVESCRSASMLSSPCVS